MTAADVLSDAFSRVRELVAETLDDLTADQLAHRPDPEANSIGWLIWHLTRVQDDHVAGVAGTEQVWTAEGYFERFGLPFEASAIGYGQRSDEVGAVRPSSPELLISYHEAVCRRSLQFVSGLTEADLGRVVDERWEPPVTLGVRLISVISDDLQHVGQAAYLRGLIR
ncbi:MAG: DUF664 domain-containing protein [Jatrophihabitantaceae bacterium]